MRKKIERRVTQSWQGNFRERGLGVRLPACVAFLLRPVGREEFAWLQWAVVRMHQHPR